MVPLHLFFNRRGRTRGQPGRALSQVLKPLLQIRDFMVGQRFQIDQAIGGARLGGNELVQLQLDGAGFFILSVLNQKHHQECDHGR